MKKLFTVLLFATISLGVYSQNYELRNINYIHDSFHQQDTWVEAELYCPQAGQVIFYLEYPRPGQASGYFELAGKKYDFGQKTSEIEMIFLDLPAGSHKLVVRMHEMQQYYGMREAGIYIASPDVNPTKFIRVEYEYTGQK